MERPSAGQEKIYASHKPDIEQKGKEQPRFTEEGFQMRRSGKGVHTVRHYKRKINSTARRMSYSILSLVEPYIVAHAWCVWYVGISNFPVKELS